MKTNRTITGKTSKSQTIEIKIEMTRNVQDKIGFADGWNINMGKETVDLLSIAVYVDGKLTTTDRHAPVTLAPDLFKKDAELIKMGAHARLGNILVNQARYNEIVAAIAEMDTELTTPEYQAVKAAEISREKANEEVEIETGLCPKCRSYCYGDCEAN